MGTFELLRSLSQAQPTKAELYQSMDMDEADKLVSHSLDFFDHARMERETHARLMEERRREAIERVERQVAAARNKAS